VSGSSESLSRTLAVVIGVAFFCSLLVSGVVYLLRPLERAYVELERNRAIVTALASAGGETLDDRTVVERFVELEALIVDLGTGEISDAVDPVSYAFRAAADDPLMRVEIPGDVDFGGLQTRPRYMPVYREPEDGRIVLPVYARGMWSTIYLFVAVEADGSTVAGVSVFEHGETPGIGDRIENPDWLGRWRGKRIYDPAGTFSFSISSASDPARDDYRVDGITGATVTVSAIDDAMRYWFSPHGYGRFLDRLAEGL
jgi:Na+-transporting NADH:ubiquinone oxidoreductase subunit C